MSRLSSTCVLSLIIIFVSTMVFLSGCSGADGNAVDGKRWYLMHNCHACHGLLGNDGGGPDIAGLSMSYRGFVHRLRNAQTQIMPEYSKERINDQDAADILAYLKTL